MDKKFYEVNIKFNKDNYEKLYNALYFDGIDHILEEEGFLKLYFDISETENIHSLRDSLIEDRIIRKKDFEIVESEGKNWNDEWENSIEPVYIKDRLIVYPSWKKDKLENPGDKILIEIDPKMSFGTGHNETTQLMLELMCDYITGEESKLLDFGCGTGVLTIAGLKLGVKNAVAIDIDTDSIENAEECFRRNEVKDRVKLHKSGISEIDEESFDIICANIIRSVITENFEHIINKIKSRGKLFISGILSSEDQEILELLILNDFNVEDIQIKSEWIGIYAVRI
ncbi:MAG: 50S ribosomal protein L11 methyltransferase [Ignavibacteria bacterium]|nr:50S ribosomal protein L11 methyltransferase [Ignavibacteria bacterium]